MLNAIAVTCAVAGFAAIAYAYFALFHDKDIKEQVKQAVADLNANAKKPDTAAAGGDKQGLAEQTAQQATFLGSGSEYIKALAELAGNLSKVSQGIAALLISTIFFAFSVTLVSIDRFKSDDHPSGQATTPATTVTSTTP